MGRYRKKMRARFKEVGMREMKLRENKKEMRRWIEEMRKEWEEKKKRGWREE